jgi:hypothetical protein
VGSLSPEQLYRIIEPLVDAGLELFRDQPPEIRAAWIRVVGRMIALGVSHPAGS